MIIVSRDMLAKALDQSRISLDTDASGMPRPGDVDAVWNELVSLSQEPDAPGREHTEEVGDVLHRTIHSGHPWSGCGAPARIYSLVLPRFRAAMRSSERLDANGMYVRTPGR